MPIKYKPPRFSTYKGGLIAVQKVEMNGTIPSKFTPEILLGAEHVGVDAGMIRALLHITLADHSDLVNGLVPLTPTQARAIEARTGRTVGDLAIVGIDRGSSVLRRTEYESQLVRETLQLMADFDAIAESPRRPASTKTA